MALTVWCTVSALLLYVAAIDSAKECSTHYQQVAVVENATLPKTQKAFRIWNDTFCGFNDTYYAVLLAEDSKSGNCSQPTTYANATLKRPIPCYYSSPDGWSPFSAAPNDALNCTSDGKGAHICILGFQNCTKVTQRCNGPLKAGVRYRLVVQASNQTQGLLSSKPVTFDTKKGGTENGGSQAVAGSLGLVFSLLATVQFKQW
ncbi:uncharacterized protein LOC135391669 [Ornithodoros turicata]|uniref:uncharacterized protein LOC135391669 n=1 Tax=Ornithodoros turicata TaxID=34597 RepID=UPI00313948B3